jgi:hypothetical protein
MQWLTAEIQEMKGNAYLWRSHLVLGESEESLTNQFVEQVNASYNELIKKIGKKNQNLSELSREYQQITERDYFDSELGRQVREKFLSLRGGNQ